MKNIYLLVTVLYLALPGFSQTMSNTDNVITLTNTCINGGMTSGTYNLVLNYTDRDNGPTTVTLNGVAVVLSGGVMTITGPGNSFPTTSNGHSFSLPYMDNGSITLSSGSFSTYMNWSLNPDLVSDAFNCVALPVWFNRFTATLSGSTVVLNWQTGMEQNSSVIEIYRSSTGSNYYKIGQVTAAGNSSIPVNYSFTDNNPDASDFYYLKIVSSVGAAGIYSSIVHVSCSGCQYTPPSPVNCPYTINGPDHICNLESPAAYTLSSAVPNYSTIVWSVDQPSIAALRTFPQFDRAKAGLLKKNAAGGVTLTATLSGCSNAITKLVAFGTPDPVITGDLMCPYLNLHADNIPGATSLTWYQIDASTGVTQSWPNWGFNQQFDLGTGDVYAFEVQYTNACGTSNVTEVSGYWCPAGGGSDPGGFAPMSVSPNPSRGIVSIGLAPASTAGKTGGAKTPAFVVKPKVYQVRIVDALGVVRKTFSYPAGVERISVDLSGLNNGIYIIQVFDNKTWKSSKVVLAK